MNKRNSHFAPKRFKGATSVIEEHRISQINMLRLAMEIIVEFDETSERVDVLLRRTIHDHQKTLDSRDKGLLTKYVRGIIQWKLRLDYLISKTLKSDASSFDPTMRAAYRLAAQILSEPPRSEEMAMVLADYALPKSHGKYREAVRNFIASFKTITIAIPMPNPKKNLSHSLSISFSHPVWLIERALSEWGEEGTRQFCEFNNREFAPALRVNTLKKNPADVQKSLDEEGVVTEKSRYSKNGLVVKNRHDIYSTESFKRGEFDIQAESSQLFCEWVDPKPGQTIWDACAGGGGKALAFSAVMKNSGKIYASDVNAFALEQLKIRADRAGSSNIEILNDLTVDVLNSYAGKVDIVVVDAPCSGLGVLQRNPDMRWRITPEAMARLAEEQAAILGKYTGLVKSGGKLVYATCTVFTDENENVVEAFLKNHEYFSIVNTVLKDCTDDRGFFKIFPQTHQLSGFFGCTMVRA